MQDWDTIGKVTLFAVAALFTPGPNALLLTTVAASHGLRPAVPAAVGVWLGIPTLIVVVAVGLGEAFTRIDWLQPALRVLATVYFLWLAWRIVQMRPPGEARPDEARPVGVFRAAVLQWVNPKVWTMAIGAVSAFASAAAAPLSEALVIGAVFTVIAAPAVLVWTLFGAAVRRYMTTPRLFMAFKAVMAGLLIGSIALTWLT